MQVQRRPKNVGMHMFLEGFFPSVVRVKICEIHSSVKDLFKATTPSAEIQKDEQGGSVGLAG